MMDLPEEGSREEAKERADRSRCCGSNEVRDSHSIVTIILHASKTGKVYFGGHASILVIIAQCTLVNLESVSVFFSNEQNLCISVVVNATLLVSFLEFNALLNSKTFSMTPLTLRAPQRETSFLGMWAYENCCEEGFLHETDQERTMCASHNPPVAAVNPVHARFGAVALPVPIS